MLPPPASSPGQKAEGPPTPLTHPEFVDSKALGQGDLEDLKAANVRRQAGQTLLATATDSDQERVTLRGAKDSADAAPGERQHTQG